MHVAINVSGPGINVPITYGWSADKNGSQPAAPASFDLEVPSGNGRLIQLLGVYENSTTESLAFSYGDATLNLPAGNVAVSLELSEVGSGNIVAGRAAGRFLTSANSGPTGIVNVRFSPGGGKPPLIVEQSFIANGWFNFFMLAGANLEYEVNGFKLFDGPVDLNSPLFVPNSGNANLDRVARASLPKSVRLEGNNQSKKHEDAAIYSWGFWSNDPTFVVGKNICNDLTAGGAFTKIFRYDSVAANANTLLVLSNAPADNQSFPTNAALLATSPALNNVFAGGGIGPTCANLSDFLLPIKKRMIDGNGGDSIAGFKNIFVHDSDGGAFSITPTGNTATIEGMVLPGIQNIYSRIKFYKRIGAVNEDFRIENAICRNIANGESGFVFAGEALTINGTTRAFSATNVGIDTTSMEYAEGRISLVACGAKGPAINDLAPMGLFQELYSHGGSGPYMRMELSGSNYNGINYVVTNGQCYPLALNLYSPSANGSSPPYTADNPVTISGLNPGGASWYEIHNTATCNSQITNNSTVTIPKDSNTYGTGLWLKPISTGPDQTFSGVSVSGDGVSFSPNTNRVNVANPSLSITGPSSALIWTNTNQLCYQVNVTTLDASGMPMSMNPSSLSLSFSGSGFTLYNGLSDCQAGSNPTTSSFNIDPGDSFKTMYLRGTTAGSQTFTIAANGLYAATSRSFDFFAESAANSSLASRFLITPLSSRSGLCNQVRVTHVNSAGNEIPVQAAVEIKLSSSSHNVQFFNDPACMTSTRTIYMNAQQSSAIAYFRATSVPGTTVAIEGSTGAASGASGNVMLTTPSTSEGPYMTYSIPNIKSVILGSHDFATPKTISFSPSAGATVSCEQAQGPSYASWTQCSPAQFSGNVFTWSQFDATVNLGFRFGVSAPSKPIKYYSFIPKMLYARHGKDFKVLTCKTTLTANETTDFADINMAQAQANNDVVCLNAGTFTQTGTAVITPLANKVLLGKTDPTTGAPATILQAVADHNLAEIALPGPIFANLDIRGSASGTAKVLVNIENGSGTAFSSYNNVYQINQFHRVGIRAHGNQGAESYGDTFIVDGSAFSTQGLVSTNCVSCSSSIIKSPLFKLYSHTSTENKFATAIKLWTSSTNMQVFDVKVDPAANQGSFLVIDNSSSSSQPANFTLNNSSFSLSGLSANSNRFPVYVSRRANINFNGVRIENSMASDLIRAVQIWDMNDLYLTMNDTKLVNHQDRRIIFFNNTGYPQNLSTTRTHFVRTTNSGTTFSAIASTAAINWTLNGPQMTNPNTYVCGTSAGTNFSAVSGSPAPNLIGGYTSPALTSSANALDLTCQ